MSNTEHQQSRLKTLIAKGKEQGYLTYADVNDHLPDDISDPEQVEDIIQMINDMGIQVFEETPDADTLLLNENDSNDEVAAAEAAAALAAVETEGHPDHQHRRADDQRRQIRLWRQVPRIASRAHANTAQR